MMISSNVYSGILGQNTNLKGLDSFYLIVDVPELNKLKPIENDVKLKLIQSGIEVNKKALNMLYINISVFQIPRLEKIMLYTIDVSIRRRVRKMDSDDVIFAEIWEYGSTGSVPIAFVEAIRKPVKEVLDKFIGDYLKVNPKQK